MNESQQNFEELKRLLKLKQHEIPPPGYFHRFSDDVLARIRAGEAGEPVAWEERLGSSAPWLLGWLRIFETKPGIVGGFATSLCLLLLMGVIFAEYSDQSTSRVIPVAGALTSPGPAPSTSLAALSAPAVSPAPDSGGIAINTNPVISLQPTATLFGQSAPAGLFQTASFVPSR